MTPLEAAKAIMRDGPTADSECPHCRRTLWEGRPFDGHAPDCPWLQMPAIVAALEAAERYRPALEQIVRDANDDPSGHGLAGIAEDALKGTP